MNKELRVFGEIIKAAPGTQERLIYDRKTIRGEIKVMKHMYPNVCINMGKNSIINKEEKKLGITYYLKDNEVVIE